MNVLETYQRIISVMHAEGIDLSDVKRDTPFVQMGVDSLEMANLVLEFEKEFNIEILDDDLKSIFTPQDVANYVYSQSHCR